MNKNSKDDSLGKAPSGILLFALLLMLVSLAFESVRIGSGEGESQSAVAVARITGYFLFLAALIDFRSAFRPIPRAFWYLCVFAAVGFVSSFGLLELDNLSEALTVPQNIILFLIVYNITRWQSGWRVLIFGLLAGIGISAMAQLTGFGVSRDDTVKYWVQGAGLLHRSSALGEDPNFVASYRAIGLAAGIMVALESKARIWWRLFGLGVGCVATISIVETTSRGGLLVAVAGVLCVIFVQRSWKLRVLAFFLGVLALILLGVLIARSPLFLDRVATAWLEGDTTNRVVIWGKSVGLFVRSPVWGYGQSTYPIVLGREMQEEARASHNIYISALLGCGILGFVPLVIVMWRIFTGCFRRRSLPDAAMALVLFGVAQAAGMSLNVELKKWFWILMAAACARSGDNTEQRSSGKPKPGGCG